MVRNQSELLFWNDYGRCSVVLKSRWMRRSIWTNKFQDPRTLVNVSKYGLTGDFAVNVDKRLIKFDAVQALDAEPSCAPTKPWHGRRRRNGHMLAKQSPTAAVSSECCNLIMHISYFGERLLLELSSMNESCMNALCKIITEVRRPASTEMI